MELKQEPLTESYFYILLCLYRNPGHGYGIMQQTLHLTGDRLKIGSGTMYGAVSNMIKKGWILEQKSDQPEDERKKLYRLTDEGRRVLQREKERLEELLKNAGIIMKGEDKNEENFI